MIIYDHRLSTRSDRAVEPFATLTLPFERRQKTRQRARLASGAYVGIQLPRGSVLRGGDWLGSDDGHVLRIVAAPERVSTATTPDATLLARAAYHLGNRHVHLEVGRGWLRYLHDHVLDGMVRALGLDVAHGLLPFEPEAGAYGGHAHGGHGHDHPGHDDDRRGHHSHDHHGHAHDGHDGHGHHGR